MNRTLKYKQRTAKGFFKPILFILLELILFALIIYITLEINFMPLTIATTLGSLYYLSISSMPRFTRVIKRQQAVHRLKKFDIITRKNRY
ncbi:MAG: hypothetical protein L3J43_04300 [Sulfurovum sp.]|nr:hypothetical protein [Sulfurovum sp.]